MINLVKAPCVLTDDELREIAVFELEPSPEDVSAMANELLVYRGGILDRRIDLSK